MLEELMYVYLTVSITDKEMLQQNHQMHHYDSTPRLQGYT